MWVMDKPNQIFALLKNEFSQTVMTKHSMTSKNFTDIARTDTTAIFPMVRFKSLPSVEQGRTFDGTGINAALFTFQIDVTDNSTLPNTAKEVMTEVMRIMKGLGFEVSAIPNFEDNVDGVHRMTARFRRLIGANEPI
jgi:hypothetical protein